MIHIRRFLMLLIFLLSVSLSLPAQEFRLSFSTGIGTFSMNDLKEMNHAYLKSLPVEARLTDDFPAHPFYNLFLTYTGNTPFYVGLGLSFASTGSRVSYKDYSGMLQFDNVLTMWAPAIRTGVLLTGEKIRISAENDLGYAFSTLKNTDILMTMNEESKYRASSIQSEPGIRATATMGKAVLSLKAGYLVDMKGNNRMIGERDVYLKTSSNKNIKTDWSGFRLGLSVGINL
jgi:hypothetical protein